MQFKRYGIKFSKIDHIFISHLHGDHYYGLIGLLSTMHLYGRVKPLILVGPPGLIEIISVQLRYSETHLNFPIEYIEWVPNEYQLIFENEKLTVHTLPLDHRVPCSGYLFKEKPKKRRLNKVFLPDRLPPNEIQLLKNGEDVYDDQGKLRYANAEVTLPPNRQLSYAFCSDTKYKPGLLNWISQTDLLYHEATFMEDMRERAENTFHTTASQAAQLALDAGVGRLLIGHFSTRYKNLDPVLREATSVFKPTSLAVEGQVFTINDHGEHG